MKPAKRIDEATVQQVIGHHFGKKPRRVEQIHGGSTNVVFEAEVAGEELILRISYNPTRVQTFMKEQWVVKKARAKKVPAPEILEVANDIIGLPYMISRKVSGQCAATIENRIDVLREMGQYAAVINSISTTDFGHIFDWSRNELSRHHSWKDYLKDGLNVEGRLKIFAASKLLRPANLKKLKAGVKRLTALNGQPTLNHGDLRLKNLVLDDKGKIAAIVDWEKSVSSLAPYWELAIALHDLGIDEKDAFLEGYGLAQKRYDEISPMIRVLNILNYAPVVEKARKRKDRRWLTRLEQRLNGSLDLYSL